MGFGGISIWQLLIILLIVVLLFGTKKLRNIGSDLGGAIKTFRKSMKEEDEPQDKEDKETAQLEDKGDKKDKPISDDVNVVQKDKA